jgi:DnaK suppressor protein
MNGDGRKGEERHDIIGDHASGTVRVVASSDLNLDAVRAELEARRDRDRERLGVLAARPERGSAVSFGKRIGDGTSEAVSRLTDVGVGESLERGLERVERALTKLDDGTYGICDVCGAPIPPGRLKAMPDGVLCVSCAASERRVRAPRRR